MRGKKIKAMKRFLRETAQERGGLMPTYTVRTPTRTGGYSGPVRLGKNTFRSALQSLKGAVKSHG